MDDYAAVPHLGYIDMGLESNLLRARETFPNARRGLMYKPTDLMNKTLETIRGDLERIAREYAPCDVIVADSPPSRPQKTSPLPQTRNRLDSAS
jgi:hypothetical protein